MSTPSETGQVRLDEAGAGQGPIGAGPAGDICVNPSLPRRIRLSRAAGWRLPDGALSVARPGRLGNPFPAAAPGLRARAAAVDRYLDWLDGEGPDSIRAGSRCYSRRQVIGALTALRGRDLACWCPLPAEGQPDICHGAVLLMLADLDCGIGPAAALVRRDLRLAR